jgi:hypothetical protein
LVQRARITYYGFCYHDLTVTVALEKNLQNTHTPRLIEQWRMLTTVYVYLFNNNVRPVNEVTSCKVF